MFFQLLELEYGKFPHNTTEYCTSSFSCFMELLILDNKLGKCIFTEPAMVGKIPTLNFMFLIKAVQRNDMTPKTITRIETLI